MTITAAADGSALGNPGPAGWAWYVNDDCWRAGGWPHGTNNQGELMAVLDLFRSTAHIPQEDLRILCDSQYVINSVTKWMPGWKRKGWRKADGKPVLNVDLLKEIDKELVGRKYTFEWVKGHAGHDLNEAADERARAVALAYQQGVAARSGPGFRGAAALEQDDDALEQDESEELDLFGGLGSGLSLSAEHNRRDPSGRADAGANAPAMASGAVPANGSLAASSGAMANGRALASRGVVSNGSAVANGGAAANGRTVANGSAAAGSGLPEELDLFSELDADAFTSPLGNPSPEQTVEALERELLRPDVRSDIGRTGVLLHPEFTEIGTSGRLWTRDAMMMSLEESPGSHMELELISVDRIGAQAILLVYRSHSREGAALGSSLWVLDGEQWRLRFHQGTPEA
ncbi:RNase H family protein [Arthrobacter sp. NPDC093125]|uniref:RNase H family protein n=1 Tax=Arthrobacter sp. NPDC093125 TaxID=3363944 RepID=UPI0038198EDE